METAANAAAQTVTVRAEDGFGGVVDQTFGLVVLAQARNRPPVIVTSPVLGVDPGVTYSQPFVATDPEGGAVTWSLLASPAGMSIAPSTGLMTWPTSTFDSGQHSITVLATDPAGASSAMTFRLYVAANQQPAIGGIPPVTNVLTGVNYTSWFDATDGNGDVLTYRVVQGPAGLTIDAQGNVVWPNPSAPGSYEVVLAASDGRGGEVLQSYTLVVTSDTTLPQVALVAEYDVVTLGDRVGFQVNASDNDQIADITLTVDGAAVELDRSNIGYVIMSRSGFVPVVATARDRSGNTATATQTIRVINPADQSMPEVSIDTAPLEATGGVIKVPTQITGNVTDDALEFWRLDIAPLDLLDPAALAADNPAYRTLGQGTTNISHANVGRVDPTVLANGSYYLRLIAGDSNGNTRARGFIVTIAGDLKLGRLLLPVTDLTIPVAGIPITVTRVYDSLEANRSGDFGFGWSLALQNARIQESIPTDPWEKQGIPPFFGGQTFDYGTRVTLLAPDGRRIGFTFQPKVRDLSIPGGPPVNHLFGTVYKPHYQPDPGVYYKLEADDDALQITGDGSVKQYLTGFSYNPRAYKLTARDGTIYRYDQFDGLQTITNRNGNVLTFTRNGIHTSSGATVSFQRDAAGRITAITDPQGGIINYTYNAAGELARVTDQAGRYTSFSYFTTLAHYLNQILDPAGNPLAITNYDGNGRLSTLSDALGNITTFVYDESNRTETETDPLGGVTKETYDERGNVLHTVNPIGAVSSSTYDASNNPLTVTPPCGCTKVFTYDTNGNQLTMTDALGNVTSMSYDANNQPLTQTDGNGHTIGYAFDANGNITAISDALGYTTRLTPDEYGRPTAVTDVLGRVTRFEYVVPDPQSAIAPSKPSRVIYPDNTSIQFIYNAFGRIVSFTNTSGATQRLIADEAGMLLRSIDALGHATTYIYNDRGELASTTNALSQTTVSEYDLMGRLLRRTDPNGRVSTWEWDKLGRLASTTDALGCITRKSYRADDALEKIQQADGTFILFDNDTNGRRTSLSDPNGNVTYFTWNSNNQITSQTDPLHHVTTPSYDKAGNLASITDRLGRVRKFTYDARNKLVEERWLTANTLQIVKSISLEYDAAGNLLAASDDISSFALTYGSRNRPLTNTATYPTLPNSTAFTLTNTYNDVGRIYTTTDSDGIQVESHLDERSQLQRLVWQGPGSFAPARVDFTRNALGDVTNIARYTGVASSQLAVNTVIELGRAKSDTGIVASLNNADGDRSAASSSYKDTDAFGPLAVPRDSESLFAQSIGSDPLQRISRITHTSGSGNILTDFQYTHDTAGKLKTESSNGDTTTYSYDLIGQLIDASYRFQTPSSETFVYDSSGNRAASSSGPVVTSYNVGFNNRILSDGTNSYAYDNEGNLTNINNETTRQRVVLKYDHRNRLTNFIRYAVTDIPIQTITFTYDLADRRIAKSVDGQATFYFYSGKDMCKQISSTSGVTRYLVGDRTDQWLASQNSSGDTLASKFSWYLTDRLGSKRAIASEDGSHMLNQTEFTSYGSIRSQTDPASDDSFNFTGREYDRETELYYYRARYYIPTLGKFLSDDPVRFESGDFNLQRYVFNRPVSLTDPSGLMADEYAIKTAKQQEDDAKTNVKKIRFFTKVTTVIAGAFVFVPTFGAGSKYYSQRTCQNEVRMVTAMGLATQTALFYFGIEQVRKSGDPGLLWDIAGDWIAYSAAISGAGYTASKLCK